MPITSMILGALLVGLLGGLFIFKIKSTAIAASARRRAGVPTSGLTIGAMVRMPDGLDAVDGIVSGALGIVLTRRPDSEVTVVIGGIMVDVIEVSYDERRDKFVLHLHAEDLAEAVHKLTVDGRP